MSVNKDIIIALDEGTTNAKAVALDARGHVVASFSRALAIQTPHEGWVEQSAELLVEASLEVVARAIATVGVDRVAALAISNQRETVVGWDRATGKPIAPALSWQCSRTAAFCHQLREQGHGPNIKADWDPEMLALFGIPRAALPDIKPSSGLFGYTRGCPSIPDGLPVMAMIGDSHAALFAHGLGAEGCVKATYGTGSSVMAPVSSARCDVSALATTVAWHDGDNLVYGLEGNIPHTGDAVAWMADSTGLSELSQAELAHELNTLPRSVDSTLGVYFVPALTGLGAPWWDENARGMIHGLSRGVKRAHLIRAALESIAYQIADVVQAMRVHPGFTLNALMVDGGPTKNDWLMQYQADLLGCPVMRSDVAELSAMGAALLARKALFNLTTAQLRQYLPEHVTFSPDMARHARLQTRWQAWQETVARVRT